jgi:3'-5' exoribonuclease
MLKQSELISLRKDNPVDHYLLVKKIEVRLTKTNKNYLFLELADKTATFISYMWDNIESAQKYIKAGDVVKAKGIIEDYQGSLRIRVDSIRLAESSENVNPSDFLSSSKRDLEEMKSEFRKRINKIRNQNLKTLLGNIFSENDFEKFCLVPAGKSWHHSYISGLLEHTLEIIRICDLMCDIHPEIDRDLLISGAMLHDFGKIEELSYETSFDYTDTGRLLGHIVIAALRINSQIEKMDQFPVELKKRLLHLILSHQGKLEYASPVVPKTIEAIALYQADELSAKVNAYKNAVASELKDDSNWTRYIPLISTELYKTDNSSENEPGKTLFD